jgi:hypothetical protein
VAQASLVVAGGVAGALIRALISSFADGPGERGDWRALRWEEVGVESCVHGTVLFRRCCDYAALAANASDTVASGCDELKALVAASCVEACRVCSCKTREGSDRGSWAIADQTVLRAGCMALTVGAVVDLDFPSRNTQLLGTSSQIHGRRTWSNEMVPAMLAGLLGDAKFCNAHGDGLGDFDVKAFARCCFLE